MARTTKHSQAVPRKVAAPRARLASRLRSRPREKAAATIGAISLLSYAAVAFTAAPLRAEEVSAENKAAARDLATEGIQLAQGGRCDEAIPKLSRAEKLFHAPTILTWIGQCQIELGRYVEGTETLNRVVREQIDKGAPEAFHAAQEKARDLIAQSQPKIAKLTIEVTPADVEGLEVAVDERPISSALVGAAKPTDPGSHTVTVSAPGYQTATKQVALDEGGRESLSFELVADKSASLPSPATTSGQDATPKEAKSSPNWLGWTALGTGAALMAGGAVTGYLAMSKEGDLDCADDGSCASSEEDKLKSARTNATVSTILFGVGGAVTVTGVILLLTGGSKKSEAARPSYVEPVVGLTSLGLTGKF